MTLLAVMLGAQTARAQDGTAAPAVPPPAPAPVVEAAPPAPPPAPPAPPVPVAEAPKPPTATEAMPASRPDALPPIQVGAWTRVGSVFQNANDPKKINDFHFDNAYVELHAGGKIHKNVGVTLNLNSNIGNFPGPSFSPMTEGGSYVAIMDAIVQFDLQDEFHLWAGHLLVPVDRSNASGPFFMIPWNYPGFFGGQVGAPKEGPSGRNNGAVVWGDIMGGKFTYLAGVFDNGNVNSSPLFSGRLRLALLDPEGGFWGNGSYFGEKDLLTIGVGAQFQKHGSSALDPITMMATDKDWADINGDVLFEKKLPGGGWVTAEGAFYHFNVLDGGVDNSFYGLLAYATPTLGVGNLQPSVRYQMLTVKGSGQPKPWNLDVGLAYLIKGPGLRVIANYSHTDFDAMDATANAVQLGAQAIFF